MKIEDEKIMNGYILTVVTEENKVKGMLDKQVCFVEIEGENLKSETIAKVMGLLEDSVKLLDD